MTAPTKTDRVLDLLDLLGEGEFTVTEILSRLHLAEGQRRNVQRDLRTLIDRGRVALTVSGRYGLPQLPSALNPVEALAVYSATRMLFHHAPEYNSHYSSALQKLTAQLPEPARNVAAMANDAYRQQLGGGASRTFELVARAWLEGRVLQFRYHSATRVSQVELVIYFIELNPQNGQTYAIGVNRLKEGAQPFVFRLSRMKELTLLDGDCCIPPDFQPLRYLANSWGIMSGAPVQVELFFAPKVHARVLESPLARQAQVQTLASGHCRVRLTVGGWLELVPWILGWGGEVEVLGPPELREAVAQAHSRGTAIYTSTPAGGGGP